MEAAARIALLLSFAAGCSRPAEGPPAITQAEVDIATRPASVWLEEEPIRLLRDYVRIDTTPAKGEEEGARFLQRFFECADIESELICPAPGRCNLFARLPGKKRDEALLLLNHIDVAPVTAAFWKNSPPFGGRIHQGYLYGRGSYDMKSTAIAQALAMRNLKEHGIVPPSDVLFLAEADEEMGQKWGSKWLLENRPDLFRGVGAVLNEGGIIEVIIRDVRFLGIETVQAGYATATFENPSKPALEALASRWRKIESTPVEPHPHVVEGFNLLANHLVSPLTDPLRHLDRVRRDPKELAVLPNRYGSFLEVRAYWSHAFLFPPEAPTRNQILVVVATPPGVEPDRYLSPIVEDAARNGMQVLDRIATGAGEVSPYPTALTDLIRRVTQAHFPGIPFGPHPTAGGYTTSPLFRRKGFPTYGFSSIPMNITDAAQRHGNNEKVFLPDYLKGVEVYRDVLEEFALNLHPISELSPLGHSN